MLLADQNDLHAAVEMATRALRLGSLPDQGKMLVAHFRERTSEMRELVESTAAGPNVRGAALALVMLLEGTNARDPVDKYGNDETFAGARWVAEGILEHFVVKDAEDSPPPATEE